MAGSQVRRPQVIVSWVDDPTLLRRREGEMDSFDRHALQTDLLQRVSRSFYLSMKFLPKEMRSPISLGYLLARASDTLADTADAPVALRRDCLERFREGLGDWGSEEAFGSFYSQIIRDFRPHQKHPGESELLQRIPEVFEWLGSLDDSNRRAVIEVLETITEGQSWDVARFGESHPGEIGFCKSAAELEAYTYQVAGCVGEFWTRIGFENRGGKFAPQSSEEDLMRSGRCLGQGLQLVNILRDLGEDLRQGRCYLPLDELIAAGWRREDSAEIPEDVLMAVATAWRSRCRALLEEGRKYLAPLKRGRVRFATALPLILAEETVDRIESAGGAVLRERVKISRSEVRKAMIKAVIA